MLDGLRRRRGLIINVASDAGLLGIAGGATYCASKGALIGLTKALAIELAPDVRAVCICPGPVATDMMTQSVAAAHDQEAALNQWTNYAPLGRIAAPREIASLIAYAASADAAFATGSVWLMDGGLTAGKRIAQKYVDVLPVATFRPTTHNRKTLRHVSIKRSTARGHATVTCCPCTASGAVTGAWTLMRSPEPRTTV